MLDMARDKFHWCVRRALEKDGWIITDDPLRLKGGKVDVEIDLGAEKLFAAEKQGIEIAVEVKNFLSHSPVSDFEDTYGQFLLYRRILKKNESPRILYAAIPAFAFDKFFQRPLIQEIIKEESINLLVFNHIEESIVKWIKW
jgi:XisH protein